VASIVTNNKRGTYQIQWFDGQKQRRVTITKKRPNWKPGDTLPKRPPALVTEKLAEYRRREKAVRDNDAPLENLTIEEFLAAFRVDYEVKVRPNTLIQFDIDTRKFLAFCAEHKVVMVHGVTRAIVNKFITARSRVAEHATVKKECALIASAWSKAVEDGRIPETPWKRFRVPGVPGKRKSSWTPEQFEKLLAASRPWLRVLLSLGVNSGLRIAALRQITWGDIVFSQAGEKGFGAIVIPKHLDKAGFGYRVPLSEKCHDLLFHQKVLTDDVSGVVIRGQNGKPIRSNGISRKAILSACKRAGLEPPDSPNHAMRRTFGRWAVQGQLLGWSVPVFGVSKWLGHHSVSQTEYYLDLSHDVSQEWMIGPSPPSSPS
jgi:integrase